MNAKHELLMWLQLLKCARNGHLMVTTCTAYKGPFYCWTCFWNYPYSKFVGLGQVLRNFVGGFIR